MRARVGICPKCGAAFAVGAQFCPACELNLAGAELQRHALHDAPPATPLLTAEGFLRLIAQDRAEGRG